MRTLRAASLRMQSRLQEDGGWVLKVVLRTLGSSSKIDI